MRARAAVLAEIEFVGGRKKIAGGNGDRAFRRNARRQQLDEFGISAGILENTDDRGALGEQEEILVVAELGGFEAFRLDALRSRAAFRIVADMGDGAFEGCARFVEKLARLVEDGEATRAALVVAFIGDDEAVVVQPLHGVRFAQHAFGFGGEFQGAVTLGVDAGEIDAAGGEVRLHLGRIGVDDDDLIVFLQRQGNLVQAVEGDEFRLRILRGDAGKAGQRHVLDSAAIDGAVLDLEDDEVAGRHLRDLAVIDVFVALVFDCDGAERLVLVEGDRIRLAAEIAGVFDLLGRHVDDRQATRGLRLAFGGVDGNERLAGAGGDRGRLAVHHHCAAGLRCLGVGNVDEADRTERAVAIDQRVAVVGRGDDFGGAHRKLVLINRQVLRNREGRDAVENRLGRGREGNGCEKHGSKRCLAR